MNLDKIITEIWDLLNVTKGEFGNKFYSRREKSLPRYKAYGFSATLSPGAAAPNPADYS